MNRRQITTGVTLLALCGLLVLGALVGWQRLFAELPAEETSQATPSTCSTENVKAGQRLRSKQVRVSVYNGGTRAGLAGKTLKALTNRGFRQGEVGNAPDDADVRRVQVWSTTKNNAEAELVARQFGKKTKVKFSDVDLGPGVDVVVGNDFDGLKKAKRSIRVKNPEEVCVLPGADPEASTNAGAR